LSADRFEQPLMTATGVASRAIAAVTCLIIGAGYPHVARNKLKLCQPAKLFGASRRKSTQNPAWGALSVCSRD
jgi:hypothetical protein